MFSVRELIAAGIVADEFEALDAFPLEMLAEFAPGRRVGCGRPPWLVASGECDEYGGSEHECGG